MNKGDRGIETREVEERNTAWKKNEGEAAVK
jgi:hypothetical protein